MILNVVAHRRIVRQKKSPDFRGSIQGLIYQEARGRPDNQRVIILNALRVSTLVYVMDSLPKDPGR